MTSPLQSCLCCPDIPASYLWWMSQWQASQTGAGQAYHIPFAVCPVLTDPVDLVYKNPLRIASGTFPETFRSLLQGGAFVIRIERYLLDSSITFGIQAQFKLCAEFHRDSHFPPDYGTQPGLVDAYNAFRERMYFMVIHELLLSIHFQDGQELQNVLFVRDTAL